MSGGRIKYSKSKFYYEQKNIQRKEKLSRREDCTGISHYNFSHNEVERIEPKVDVTRNQVALLELVKCIH